MLTLYPYYDITNIVRTILWLQTDSCSRSYKYKKGLDRHLEFKCGVEPQFECIVCGKMFKQRCSSRSIEHSRHHHPRLSGPFPCSEIRRWACFVFRLQLPHICVTIFLFFYLVYILPTCLNYISQYCIIMNLWIVLFWNQNENIK